MQIFIFLTVQDCSQHHTHELYLVLFWMTRPRLTWSQWQEMTPGIHSSFPWESSLFPCTTLSCCCPPFICASVQMTVMRIHIKAHMLLFLWVLLSSVRKPGILMIFSCPVVLCLYYGVPPSHASINQKALVLVMAQSR